MLQKEAYTQSHVAGTPEVRAPLSEFLRQSALGDDGGFVHSGLVVDKPEGVHSNIKAAGVVTGLAAIKAGLGPEAVVNAAVEATTAAVRTGCNEKRAVRVESSQAYKKKEG